MRCAEVTRQADLHGFSGPSLVLAQKLDDNTGESWEQGLCEKEVKGKGAGHVIQKVWFI